MKKIILICLSALFLISCESNFLDTAPENQLTDGTFYKTEDHFTKAVNGVYNILSNHEYQRSSWLMGEMRSDNTHYNHYANDRGRHLIHREDIANFMVEEQNEHTAHFWRLSYVGISRANTLLDRIEDKGFSTEFKENIIAEAKFLRAYFYFGLVKNFGEVPLNLHEVKSAEEAFMARESVDKVYAAILDDIKYAVEKLPVVKFNSSGSATGNATKGAAKMLYAYILMTKPDRDDKEAEKQLRDIMQMGYGLMDNYADVFDTTKKNSKEHIFSAQYMEGDNGLHSIFPFEFLPKVTNASVMTGHPSSNTLGIGGWNIPNQRMIDSYEANDERLPVSIAIAAGVLEESGAMLTCDAVLAVGDPEIANYKYTSPFINKYRHPFTKDGEAADNFPIYRYADVLLLLAENLVEQGRASEAEPYVNQVRTRAGLPKVATITAEVVANERKHELAFENHRWYDLVRTGKAIEVMTEYGKYIKTVDHRISDKAYVITKEKFIHPVPYREISINPDLTQNPGY